MTRHSLAHRDCRIRPIWSSDLMLMTSEKVPFASHRSFGPVMRKAALARIHRRRASG